MLEAKVLAQSDIGHFDGHGHELPALETNVGLVTTCTDIIIICKINIEADLFGDWFEGVEVLELFSVAWVGTVDRSNVEPWRDVLQDVFSHSGQR